MTRHRERQTAPCPSHQISTYSTIHNNQKQANIRENRKRESLPYPVETKENDTSGEDYCGAVLPGYTNLLFCTMVQVPHPTCSAGPARQLDTSVNIRRSGELVVAH
jgi:hypothetical protein